MSGLAYDLAHRLSQALRDSEEYKLFLQRREAVKASPEAAKMLDDYRRRQLQLQLKHLQGEEIPTEERERFQKIVEAVNLHKPINDFIQAEAALGQLIQDIQKILFGDLEIGLDETLDDLVSNDDLDNLASNDDPDDNGL